MAVSSYPKRQRWRLMIRTVKRVVNGSLGFIGLRIIRKGPDRVRDADAGVRQLLRYLGITVVFDVGAHMGEYAMRLRNLGYQGRIVSFEPQAEAFAALSKRALVDEDWVALHLALGDQEGEQVLNSSRNSWSSSFLPILPHILEVEASIKKVGTERVRIGLLDNIYKNLTNPSDKIFMKIDVQGYEPAVLAGASEFLSCCVAVQLEMALLPSYQGQVLFPEMIDFMRRSGFAPVHFERGFWDGRTGYLVEADGIFVRAEILERDFPRGGVADGASC
jgi:FkbM family methyltransferase